MTEPPRVEPMDAFNEALVANVRPGGWTNPTPAGRYNLVVVGAGAGGLVSAMGAAGLGAKVALVEEHLLGGDCLNVGCVPSKCLIRSARQAALMRRNGEFGLAGEPGRVDFPAVARRMRRLRSEISRRDAAARLAAAGVDVYFGRAEFLDRRSLAVGNATLRFARAILATGARPRRPAIEGLEETGYRTNETLFTLTDLPRRLAVVGAGPIGCEMAQAFRRFGAEVTIIDKREALLPREDNDAAAILLEAFRREKIAYLGGRHILKADADEAGKILVCEHHGRSETIAADEILVGVGRTPNVEGMGLDRAGVAYDGRTGVKVDDRLRTTNRRIYAVGDCCSPYKFTHASDAMARIALANALFAGRKKTSELVIPWCTYTDPEIAHVGLYPRQAEAKGVKIDTYTQPFAEIDRAVTDGETVGFVKIHTAAGDDEILGATIVAAHAGDMISQITQAMVGDVGLGKIASMIFPYPTEAEALKRAADAFNRRRLSPRVTQWLGRWHAWRRR